MVPEDRKRQGLVLRRSVAENLMLPSLPQVHQIGSDDRSKAKRLLLQVGH